MKFITNYYLSKKLVLEQRYKGSNKAVGHEQVMGKPVLVINKQI